MDSRPRVRKARRAGISLETTWLEHFEIASLEAEEDGAEEVSASRPELRSDPADPARTFIRQRVRVTGPRHRADITMAGIICVTTDDPDETAALLRYNAPSLLLGVMRGVVGTVGELLPNPVSIPAIDLTSVMDDAR